MSHFRDWLYILAACGLAAYLGRLRFRHGKKAAKNLSDAIYGGSLTAIILLAILIYGFQTGFEAWRVLSLVNRGYAFILVGLCALLSLWFWQDAYFYCRQKRTRRDTAV